MSTADELREPKTIRDLQRTRRFRGSDTTEPAVAAALDQAMALHRLADALAPLERIAGAMEANRARGEEPMLAKDWRVETKVAQREPDESEAAMELREAAAFGLCAPQEPPQPASATPGGHPLDQGGWIRSRVPTEGDGDADGDVRVLRRDGKSSHWCLWSIVVLGQPWVRSNVRDPSSAPAPLPAHLAYPTSEGWVHNRVPGPEDGDEGGDVEIAAAGVKHFDEFPDLTDRQRIAGAYISWSHVVPGQPWRPLRTTAP